MRVLALLAMASCCACTSNTTVEFQPKKETVNVPQFALSELHAVGAGARDLLVTDCNGDAHLDLIVANSNDATLSVLVGHGDGSFDTQLTVPAGQSPWALGMADINGDGDDDIVVGNFISGASLMLGDGNCGFAPPSQILGAAPIGTFSSSALAIAAADLDRDGSIDVVAEASEDGGPFNLALLWGNGDGSFEMAEMLEVGSLVGDVVVRDVDADGQLDLVASSSRLHMGGASFVHVVRGRGNRNFAEAADYPVNLEPENLAIDDVDGDGNVDIVTAGGASTGNGSLSLLRGDGSGSFEAQLTFPTGGKTGGENGAKGVAAGMLNDDDRVDVVVALGNQNGVAILLGAPDGQLSGPQRIATGDNPIGADKRQPTVVRLGDFNEDGALDIAATNFAGNLSLLLSQ